MLGDLRLNATTLRLCGDIETYSPNKGFTVKKGWLKLNLTLSACFREQKITVFSKQVGQQSNSAVFSFVDSGFDGYGFVFAVFAEVV